MERGPQENFMIDRRPVFGRNHPDWNQRLIPGRMLDWGPRLQNPCGGVSIAESAKAGCAVCKRKLGKVKL